MLKDQQRDELAQAMERFIAAGGSIEESPILSHREDKLRPDMREFDRAREVAVAKGKRAERAATPSYMRAVRAMKNKG